MAQGCTILRLEEDGRREAGSSDFSWELLVFANFIDDPRCEILEFRISTFHFMMCFHGDAEETHWFYEVFRGRRAPSIVNYEIDFLQFQTACSKHSFSKFPEKSGVMAYLRKVAPLHHYAIRGRMGGGRQGAVISAGRYWHLTIVPMILDGRYWNPRFEPLILWCVLKGCRKKTLILWCVLKAASAKYCKLRERFSGISDSMA